MVNMRLAGLLILLAPGAVSGAAVVNGTNTCLDSTHEDFSCSLYPGGLTIDMTGCGIVDSDADDLEGCLNHDNVKDLPISVIILGQNGLTELPGGIFERFAPTLQRLHLEENQLEVLQHNVFAGMSSLVWLHLQGNSLTALPSSLFNGLAMLQFLDLAANSLLQCVPSTSGTRVQPADLKLPDGFDAAASCVCIVGGCEVDCADGSEGYVCSGGPTPSPITPAPVTSTPGSPPGSPPAATPVPATPTPVTPSPSTALAAPNADPATPAPTTPVLATPAPTTASEGGPGTTPSNPSSTSLCNNGIPGLQVGDACCVAECSQCGGVECSQLAAVEGLTAAECCVNTILASKVECGNGVVAPCINLDTPAPTSPPGSSTPSPITPELACSALETEAACKEDTDCLQCMFVTTIEQEDEWKECMAGYSFDENDPCSSYTAMACCLLAVGDDCDTNAKFIEYSECYIEESSGGAGCSTPLTCDNIKTFDASVAEGSAAGRLVSTLNGVGSFMVVMVLALVGAAHVQ